MRRAIVLSFIVFPWLTASIANVSECEGVIERTGAPVYGECTDGEFVGYISRTGKPVYGQCEESGEFTGYVSETGASVRGQCGSDRD